ncbi:MAG: glycosyltransferase [Blastocatellia bacterium]
MRTLYFCYFGLREPLVQTQVLPYLRHLARSNLQVHLLTFETESTREWPEEEVREWQERLKEVGIQWHSLTYHKRPSLLATLYDILAGTVIAMQLGWRHQITVFHARSHVAAVMAALARLLVRTRLIFDIRGFMPEEYADAGVWRQNSLAFRLTKAAERWLLKSADGFVVLTERARQILFNQPDAQPVRPVAVIPCCVDTARFLAAGRSREQMREFLGVTDRQVILYTGALGGWYLTEQMADFLAQAHRRNTTTFSLILTQSRPELISEPLSRAGVNTKDYLVRRVSPDEVPEYLRASDFALSFIKPCYSKLSSSPTKIAEYLISGLPVISNRGIGDLDQVIGQDRVGVLLNDFSATAYAEALDQVQKLKNDPDLPGRCRQSALNRFDLDRVGGPRYLALYDLVLTGVSKQIGALDAPLTER